MYSMPHTLVQQLVDLSLDGLDHLGLPIAQCSLHRDLETVAVDLTVGCRAESSAVPIPS